MREVEEAEEWVVEGASHGLADTTCFELYGFPNQAPALSDSPNSKAQVTLRRLAVWQNVLTCDLPWTLGHSGPVYADFEGRMWQSGVAESTSPAPWTRLWLIAMQCVTMPRRTRAR